MNQVQKKWLFQYVICKMIERNDIKKSDKTRF